MCFLVIVITPAHALLHLGEEPPGNLIVESNGLEWVWASPCRHQSFGDTCTAGIVEHHGFHLPEMQDYLQSFQDRVRFNLRFAPLIFGTPITVCASAYFDKTFDHCNWDNLRQGFVGPNYPFGDTSRDNYLWYSETLLVRDVNWANNIQLPAPSTLILLSVGVIGWVLFKWNDFHVRKNI